MLGGSIRGCRVEVRFSCLALLAFCFLFGGGADSAWALLAVLCHELSHLAFMLLLGSPPRELCLSALGCRVVTDSAHPLSYGRSALVSLAGPAGNLCCFLLMMALGRGEHSFALASLGLGLFHALPIQPLDGGLALRALLSLRLGSRRAERVAFGLSLGFLLPLAAAGFWVLLRTRYNFTLLALSVYLMLTLVLGRDFFL